MIARYKKINLSVLKNMASEQLGNSRIRHTRDIANIDTVQQNVAIGFQIHSHRHYTDSSYTNSSYTKSSYMIIAAVPIAATK